MARLGKARQAASQQKRAAGGRTTPIVVTEQERRHLIDDIAYFHAERFRPVGADGCREQDKRKAAAEIETVLRYRGKR